MGRGGLLFVDGWESLERWETEPDWRAFKIHLEDEPDFMTWMLPLEKGHLIAVKV